MLSGTPRLTGQIDAVKPPVAKGDKISAILVLLATVRSGLNRLAELLKDHIRLQVTHPDREVAAHSAFDH